MLWFFFALNMWFVLLLYSYLLKKRHRTENSATFIVNVTMTPPFLFALCNGLLFTHMYPGFLVETSIAAAFLGASCGLLFGSLFDNHSSMFGGASGILAGIISPFMSEITGRSLSLLLFTHAIFFLFLLYLRYQKFNH